MAEEYIPYFGWFSPISFSDFAGSFQISVVE
jgi:hypothetical protein